MLNFITSHDTLKTAAPSLTWGGGGLCSVFSRQHNESCNFTSFTIKWLLSGYLHEEAEIKTPHLHQSKRKNKNSSLHLPQSCKLSPLCKYGSCFLTLFIRQTCLRQEVWIQTETLGDRRKVLAWWPDLNLISILSLTPIISHSPLLFPSFPLVFLRSDKV